MLHVYGNVFFFFSFVGLFIYGEGNSCLTAASSVTVELFSQFYFVFIHECIDVAQSHVIVVV